MTTRESTGQHAAALAAAGAVLGRVREADLSRPTPCRGWDLRALIEHMIGQNEGFTRAIAAGDADLEAYSPRRTEDAAGLVRAWEESAGRLRAAEDGADPAGTVRLVEVAPDRTFALDAVIGMQLLDTVVHTWDVAAALGEHHRPEQPLLDLVVASALLVPDGDSRTRPGAAFAPAVEASASDPWIATLARLGRRP